MAGVTEIDKTTFNVGFLEVKLLNYFNLNNVACTISHTHEVNKFVVLNPMNIYFYAKKGSF